MKKFWNLMLAALVIIGATACTENYENIENAESFSFYAEIGDDTRAYIADENGDKTWETKWELGDKLYVNDTYEFVCTDVETGKFTCTAVGVSKLAGEEVTITTDGTHHSLQGKSAFYTTASVENFGEGKVKLQALTSFFRLTYNGESDLTLTLTEASFKTDAKNTAKSINVKPSAEEQFIAFWPTGNEVTLSYSTNGQEGKSVKKAFTPAMVYNLGTLNEVKTPEYKIYVYKANNSWTKVNLYTWYKNGSNNVEMAGSWPGTAITTKEKINGHEYLVYTMPEGANDKDMYLIFNNGTVQISDYHLGTLNKDYYLLLNGLYVSEITDKNNPVANLKKYLYLKPNSNWTQANARFAAYFFNNSTNTNKWVNMENKGSYYAVEVQQNYPNVIFCRMNPSATANNWNNKWNQTSDLSVSGNENKVYTVKDGTWNNGAGTWSVMQ